MPSTFSRHIGSALFAVALSLWIALPTIATAQHPDEVPGLEDLDSIPASSGYRLSTCRTVFIDTLGVRSDSSLKTIRRFDARGRIVELIGYDGLDEEAYRQIWEYDAKNGLVRRSQKRKPGAEESLTDWWYTHDRTGRLIHAEDSVSKVAVDYRYGEPGSAGPCIAIGVTGRYQFSGIDTYCDSLGHTTRQIGYIGGSDTVVAITSYPSPGERHRKVYSDEMRRVREWIYRLDSAGRVLSEEYRTGAAERTEPLYRTQRTFENGLLLREESHNFGLGDWVDYYEYR
jgi:hypothetical protein